MALTQQPPVRRVPTVDHRTVRRHVASCPDCDGPVVDGQGLLDCYDCEWTGRVA